MLANIKVTGTLSLLCHKLACNTLPTKSYKIFRTTSRYRGHSVVVWHNSKLAKLHSRVRVGGCSMEFEYSFLHQFARAVTCRMPYISVLSICTASLQGHIKSF